MPDAPIAKTVSAAVEALNPKQRAAYDEPGNTVLLAGPGSGKTATLVLRVAKMLEATAPPRGVACLTYSTEAAREFERRLRDLGIRSGRRLFTGTVHAFCLSQVIQPFSYLLSSQQRLLAEAEIATDKELAHARAKGLEAARIKEDQSWWRSEVETYRRLALVDPSLAAQLDERLPAVCSAYADTLRSMGRIDFDDIILGALALISGHEHVGRALIAKYPWLVVDEYQDLGLPLHRIVTTLMDRHGANVFAVGDPDQSIYAFSGARPEFLKDLTERHDVSVHRLELNYRCRQEIIDASLHVLQASEVRNFRASETDTRGELVFAHCPTGLAEQAQYVAHSVQALLNDGVSPGDIAVLGPRWDDLYALEETLGEAGIPYRLIRSRDYRATATTSWVEDAATWCAGGWKQGRPRMFDVCSGWSRILRNVFAIQPQTDRLIRDTEVYDVLARHRAPEGRVSDWIEAIAASLSFDVLISRRDTVHARVRYELDQLDAMLSMLRRPPHSDQTLAEFAGTETNKVVVQTLHGSKGLEYSVVHMIALESGVIPGYKKDQAEARRLFYVGMTRARKQVHLLWSGFYVTTKGKRLDYGASPFLRELQRRLERSTARE